MFIILYFVRITNKLCMIEFKIQCVIFFWRVNLPAGDCDAVIKRKQNVRQFRSKDNKTRKKGCFCPFCLFTKFVDDFCKINLSFDRQKHSATGSSILMNFTFEKVLDW